MGETSASIRKRLQAAQQTKRAEKKRFSLIAYETEMMLEV
jgi:hypothetical protein